MLWIRHVSISFNDLFFLLATLFCCGVYGIECSIWIPYDSQYWWKYLLMYSPPLSDLKDLTFFLKLFSIKVLKTFKIPNTPDLCFMKYTQQNLEQSLIKVSKNMEPLIYVVGIDPNTSLCIKSSTEEPLCAFPTSYLFSGCLHSKQPRHTPIEVFMRGKPSTIF